MQTHADHSIAFNWNTFLHFVTLWLSALTFWRDIKIHSQDSRRVISLANLAIVVSAVLIISCGRSDTYPDADERLKVGFHYPSSRPEFTARELGCIFWHPSTRAVNSGSGNRPLLPRLSSAWVNCTIIATIVGLYCAQPLIGIPRISRHVGEDTVVRTPTV